MTGNERVKSKKKIAPLSCGRNIPALTTTVMKLTALLTCLALAPLLRAADDEKKDAAPPKEESAVNELPRVSAGDIEGVKKLIGKKAVVFGKVISANESAKAGISFLDLDGGKFTVVCFKDNYARFPEGQSPDKIYKGKDIEITGEIFEYRAKGKGDPKPEIKLTEPSQIKIIEKEAPKKEGDKKSAKPETKPDDKTESPKRVEPKKFFK